MRTPKRHYSSLTISEESKLEGTQKDSFLFRECLSLWILLLGNLFSGHYDCLELVYI